LRYNLGRIVFRDFRERGGEIMPAITKEEAFADLVRDYENLWVAIIERDGVEYVVGHGSTAVEASTEARAKGHTQPTLFKVPSFKHRFVY
jgi:hypothetical protein